ncbi:MAG: DUF4268 domain-containing protein [Gammaproteobacteria bacterium]|nr:DUF4268 domain-containing protein [Gammaproteobacteria bacterium]
MSSRDAMPIIVGPDGSTESLQPTSAEYDEGWLQDLLFEHPEALPINEIDRTFAPAIPICKELNTPAGPMDALLATPKGRLIILETKLWRNPEARRAVIGQILDYAKELSRLTYADLQREVSRRTGRSGNALFDIVAAAETSDSLTEAEFVDEVSRSLRYGRFLLLICGDGIREGVTAITDFLQRQGTLHFTFGLVEVAMYEMPEGRRLVQPRILAQSVIVKRTVVSLESEGLVADEDEEGLESELSDSARFYQDFWKELIDDLELDDPDQPHPNLTKSGNVFFRMPHSDIWIALYFVQKECRVGAYLTAYRGNFGNRIFEQLSEDKDRIEEELGIPVQWTSEDGRHWIGSSKKFPGLMDPTYRTEIKDFLADISNRFVNVFRHRIKRIVEDLGA